MQSPKRVIRNLNLILLRLYIMSAHGCHSHCTRYTNHKGLRHLTNHSSEGSRKGEVQRDWFLELLSNSSKYAVSSLLEMRPRTTVSSATLTIEVELWEIKERVEQGTQDTDLWGSYVQGDGVGGELVYFHHFRSAGEEILNPVTE